MLDGATQDGGRRVAYVTSGHPLVLVTPAQLILKEANERAITVEVIPGVSSLDTVWADLGFDPGPDGVLMFEATSLLLRQYPLIPTVPLFLWQRKPIIDKTLRAATSSAEHLHGLIDMP